MTAARLTFEQRQCILKCFIKYYNAVGVRMHGTICDIHKGRSVRSNTDIHLASSTLVLETFTASPHECATQGARDVGTTSTSVQRILNAAKWKVYIPPLLHTINDEQFVTKVVWSDEAPFGVNHHLRA
ncbi:hypothetical protein FQR65_LT07818 [Abscondita terminalis]|nr:hypothetical protein FQR65_LT07818 [Abscondita terminalis]